MRRHAVPLVHFTSNLQRHVPCPSVDVAGDTVGAALHAAFERNPRLRSYLLDDRGHLRRHVNIFLNGRAVRDRTGLSDAVSRGDELYVFQALTGG